MSSGPPKGSFVLDENLSAKLARAMALLDETAKVHHVTEFCDKGTQDPELLPLIGKAEAFLVTRDLRQRRRPAELDAWKASRLGVFILGGKNLSAWGLARQLVLGWPKIKEAALKTRRPFAFMVRPGGGQLDPVTLP